MNCLKFFLNTKSFESIKVSVFCRQLSCLQNQIRRQSTHQKIGEKSTDLNLDLTANRSGNQLIYSGPENMVKMIKMIKKFSLSTTLIAGGVQPFIFQKIFATNSSSFAIGFAALTSAGIVLSPLLLNWLTKRYVTHLYYNYETQVFTACFLNLFCRRVSLQFKASDVLVPEVLGIFSTFTVEPKKKPFFVDPEFVTDLNAFKLMMGYDKPLDIKLDKILNTELQNEEKTK